MSVEAEKAMNGAARKMDTTANKMWLAVRVVGALVVITLVFQFAIQYQILQLHDSVEHVDRNTRRNAISAEKTEKNVDGLTAFTHDLQTQTPEEQASSQATQNAVRLVPVIVQILCSIYPNAEGCPPA